MSVLERVGTNDEGVHVKPQSVKLRCVKKGAKVEREIENMKVPTGANPNLRDAKYFSSHTPVLHGQSIAFSDAAHCPTPHVELANERINRQ